MWSDNETNVDLINVQHIVGAVTGLIENAPLLPLTIGVFGDWGSGKSSVMQMTQEHFKDQKHMLCLPFNGWLFEGNDDAKSALMGCILDELEKHLPRTQKAKKLFQKQLKRVNWLQLMGLAGKQVLSLSLTGLPHLGSLVDVASSVKEKVQDLSVDDAKKLVKESPEPQDNIRRTVREFRQDFAKLLALSKVETLVVLIDDLDRCLPDTIIETLEAIKLFLYVPRTAFVIGADERLVQHAVKRRFPEIGDDTSSSAQEKFDLGRDYLEKLVQIPVRIPPMGQSEVETYINLLFAQLSLPAADFESLCNKVLQKSQAADSTSAEFSLSSIKKYLIDPSPTLLEDLTLSQQTADVLTRILRGNPRQIKRFLNTLLLRISMAKAKNVDLKRRVMAKLMLLEEFKPNLFGSLAQWQAEANGRPVEINALETHLQSSVSATGQPVAPMQSANGQRSPAGSPEPANVPERARAWLEDEWLKNWISSDPPLGQENLGPYFYVARDKIGAIRSTALRLSEEARRVLALYLSASAAERTSANTRAADLSNEDAATLLKALAERSGRSEDLGQDGSPLKAIVELVKAKHSVASEAIAFLESLNPKRIPVSFAVSVQSVSTAFPAVKPAINALLQKWASSGESPHLAAAATLALKTPAR